MTNQLIAKVNGTKNEVKYYKLLSGDEEIYTFPQNLTFINFDPETLLEEFQWYKIDNFSKTPYFLNILNSFSSTSFPMMDMSKYSKITYIISCQNQNNFYFQSVTRSNLLQKRVLSLSGECRFYKNSKQIVIKHIPDAAYFKNEDRLVFRSLSAITKIFPEIKELFREATDEETISFLHNDMVSLRGGFTVSSVGILNRKRILRAQKVLDSLSPKDKRILGQYINEYCGDKLGYDKENNKIQIGSDKELKFFIYGVEQKYFRKIIGNEPCIANSTITIESFME